MTYFQAKLTDHTKGRLYSEKINKNDRKNRAEIQVYEKVCTGDLISIFKTIS